MSKNHFYIIYPQVGIKIKSMLNSPKIKVFVYSFCGTWRKENNEYVLTSINWQNSEGNVISNDKFLSIVLAS